MQLGLSGTRTDSADGDEVGEELRGYGVEHFAGNRHASCSQVGEHLARHAQALIDFEGLVDIRIVDQTLPADGGAGLLEVGAHDDAEVGGEAVGECLETVGVLEGGGGVVDGAGADDYEQAIVLAHDDVGSIVAALDNGLERGVADGYVLDQERGLDERVLPLDCERGKIC